MNLHLEKEPQERFSLLVEKAKGTLEAKWREDIPRVFIGMATCGLAAGAYETRAVFEEVLAEQEIKALIIPVGCLGHCYAEPLVVIENPGFPPIAYHDVTPGKAKVLVKSFLAGGDPLFEYVLGAMEENELIPTVNDFPRFSLEQRIVMKECGLLDPADINQYLAKGGYASLLKALNLPPAEIVRVVTESGLRGRGGAGFPTGRKWDLAAKAEGNEKTVICNADEGDPGAYMDRTLLESNPHQLLEGLAICAYSVGASNAVVYVRAEYPLAVEKITTAIDQATRANLLGESILGTAFDLDVSVFQGSGAFVCGEETALIQSVEGNRGMPQYRPPYPVQHGLWGQPTVINNVKTLSTIPAIIRQDSLWFRTIGAQNSPGTAIFSVVGKVIHPGLVEIPMGTTLRTLIFEICGGIPKQKQFKAVQIGGPSGGCLPESFLDTPVDFDSLTQAGAMMGSGGMVVSTQSPAVRQLHRSALQLLLSAHRVDCRNCPSNKHCDLQQMAKLLGVSLKVKHLDSLAGEIDADLGHPVLDYDPGRSVLCGKCIYVCGQQQGHTLLTFARRGFDTVIGFMGKKDPIELPCLDCLACTEICPVSAIYLKNTDKLQFSPSNKHDLQSVAR